MEKQLAALSQRTDSGLQQTLDQARTFLSAENVTNQMLKLFIERVYVYSGMKIEIVYRFSNPFRELLERAKFEGDEARSESYGYHLVSIEKGLIYGKIFA